MEVLMDLARSYGIAKKFPSVRQVQSRIGHPTLSIDLELLNESILIKKFNIKRSFFMSKTIINTHNAPVAVGPYSQAIKLGNTIYTSGQLPLDPNTGDIFGNTIQEQTHRVLKNLNAILEEAKTNFKSVIKTTCYLANMDDFASFNKVYAEYFKEAFPARSCVAVKTLPKNVLVEVEAIAICNE